MSEPSSRALRVDLTLVLEMETREITGGTYDTMGAVRDWVRQARALTGANCEVVIASEYPCPDLVALGCDAVPISNVVRSGVGYYGLKNAGAEMARGEVVVFSDSDCRPGKGFLAAAMHAFADPEVSCVAGVTAYDGTGFLTRMNTVTSFGYLHQGVAFLESFPALSHNVAVRRSRIAAPLFGPFRGRSGGDVYMTDHFRAKGAIPIEPKMRVYHEDSTWKLRGLLDRHLREIFLAAEARQTASGRTGRRVRFAQVLRAAIKRPRRQMRSIRRFGPGLGIGRRHHPGVAVILGLHALLYVPVSLAIAASPRLDGGWRRYQFRR